MNKVYFKKSELESIVLPEIQKAIIELESAKSIASSLDIPGFSHSEYLANLSGLISEYIVRCKNITEWLERSINNYGHFSDDTVSNFNGFVTKEVDVKVEHANILY